MKKLHLILFMVTGMLLMPCCSDEDEPSFVAGNIIVGFEKEVTLRQAYEFANRYADSIGYVHGSYYYSNLPLDSLEYVANEIAIAGFPNKGVRIGFVSNRIEIIMDYGIPDDKSTLKEWIELTERPDLQFEQFQAYKSMLLYIDPGTEKNFQNLHLNDTLIHYIELDYYIP